MIFRRACDGKEWGRAPSEIPLVFLKQCPIMKLFSACGSRTYKGFRLSPPGESAVFLLLQVPTRSLSNLPFSPPWVGWQEGWLIHGHLDIICDYPLRITIPEVSLKSGRWRSPFSANESNDWGICHVASVYG